MGEGPVSVAVRLQHIRDATTVVLTTKDSSNYGMRLASAPSNVHYRWQS